MLDNNNEIEYRERLEMKSFAPITGRIESFGRLNETNNSNN